MLLQIIFFASMYWILPVLYIVMKGAGDAKNGYSFGVRMKTEWVKDTEMEQIIAAYKRQLKRSCMALAVIPFSSFLTDHFSLQFTVWILWMLAVIIVPGVPYIIANKKTREIKRKSGWQQEKPKDILVEMKGAGEVRRVKLGTFLVPAAVSLLAAAGGVLLSVQRDLPVYGGMITTFALLTVLFYFMARWMDRQKAEVVSGNSDVNLNYARAKKNAWKNFWLALSWLNTGYVVFGLLTFRIEWIAVNALLWGSIIYVIGTFVILVWVWRKIVRIEDRYVEKRDIDLEESSDDCWIWGSFYYNKNDKRVMVNKRAGVGTTMNMATPLGMGMNIFGTVSLLCIPFFCIWMILEEFTPIRLAVEEQVLVAEHLKADYEIPLKRIDELELIDEPPRWSKVNGTGMENLQKGTFHIRNVGKCEVFLNPQNKVFLHFEAEGTEYYMSGADDEETMEIYDLLTNGSGREGSRLQQERG